jgi:drug/metabolite transporter (DMT)-like permease
VSRALWTGGGFALVAGLLWGLVFIAPTLLAEYPPWMLSMGRYLAFGLIALPLGWLDRRALAQLRSSDWLEALKLSVVGNLLYYGCLAAAIQLAGGPMPTMIIGTLPVVIAVVSQWQARSGRHSSQVAGPVLSWRRLAPSLLLIAAGLACVNHEESSRWLASGVMSGHDWGTYAQGAMLAVCAVACWTWYPIRNSQWLRAHPERSSRVWATAQGLTTLPLAVVGFAVFWLWRAHTAPDWPMPYGPRPVDFVALMLAIGLLASWLGTLCWNEASQRLPPTLSGQLIVFETLSALAYAWLLRGEWPQGWTLTGAALLVVGVMVALRPGPKQG